MSSNRTKVAVLGLGMAGAYAAKAASDKGCFVHVYQHGETEFPLGAFWQHWVPPDIAEAVPATSIRMIPEGTASKYMSLQWGRVPNNHIKSSFPKRTKVVAGYNPEKILAAMQPENIIKLEYPLSTEEIFEICEQYDFVFQTFRADYSFADQKPLIPFWTAAMYDSCDPEINEVWYNGTGNGHIVRSAKLWGNQYFEFPKYLSYEEIRKVTPARVLEKMVFQELKDMSPFTVGFQPSVFSPSNLYFAGRWAEWNNKRLTHQVYALVEETINAQLS